MCNLDSILSTSVKQFYVDTYVSGTPLYVFVSGLALSSAGSSLQCSSCFFFALEKSENDENYNSDFKMLLRRQQVNFLVSGQDITIILFDS